MLKHEKLSPSTLEQAKCLILHKRRSIKARNIEKITRIPFLT